jgi:hypothetical protein
MRFVIWTIVIVCLSLLSRSVSADTITLTDGSGGFHDPLSIHEGFGTARLSGAGLFLDVFLEAQVAAFPCEISGPGCMRGDRVSLSFPSTFDTGFSGQGGLLNGIPVNFAEGDLEFIAHGLTAVRTDEVVRTPFSLGGHVTPSGP